MRGKTAPGRTDGLPATGEYYGCNARAKMAIVNVERLSDSMERLTFSAVAKSGSYPADGSDEDNTYAKYSPSGSLSLTVANPNLLGKFKQGEKYYLDFTLAPE